MMVACILCILAHCLFTQFNTGQYAQVVIGSSKLQLLYIINYTLVNIQKADYTVLHSFSFSNVQDHLLKIN